MSAACILRHSGSNGRNILGATAVQWQVVDSTCQPVQIQLYYNPRDTPLAWREEIWVRGGFNRWRHKYTFGPVRMTPPGEGGEHFCVRAPPAPTVGFIEPRVRR